MPEPGERADPVHPHQILGAWGQTLLNGRRIALLGDTSSGLSEWLAQASGRRVHAFDPDATRAAAALAQAASDKVSYGAIDADLDLRKGAYDAVVIPDLAAFADTKAAISHARELLSQRGVLVLASPAEGGPGYYELYDLVADAFGEVTMLGQAPFAGFTVATFGAEGEPAVLIDSSLMLGSEEPRSYLVVASDQPATVEPYTLVQLPSQIAGGWMQGPRPELADARELAEARLDNSLLRDELRKGKEHDRERSGLLAEQQRLERSLSMRVAELERELAAHQTKASARANTDRERVAALERQLSQAIEQVQQLRDGQQEQLRDSEESFQRELDTMLDRIAELEDELASAQTDAKAAAAAAEQAKASSARIERADKAAQLARREAAEAKSSADQRIADIKAKADKQLADAKVNADKQLADAKANADKQLADAKANADKQLAETKAHADQRIAEIKARAEQDAIEAKARADKRLADSKARAEDRLAQAQDKAERAAASAATQAEGAATASPEAHAFQLAELRDALAAARAEADTLRADNKRLDKLKAELAPLREQLAQQRRSPPLDEQAQHLADIDRLEAQLSDRAAVITKLQADLRESDRTGRELVAALLEAHKQAHAATPLAHSPEPAGEEEPPPAQAPAPAAPQARPSDAEGLLTTLDSSPESQPEQLRSQFDALLQRCSRYEADLQAASWKIDSLTVELEQLHADSTPDHIKLETALRDAHEELARLHDASPQRERV